MTVMTVYGNIMLRCLFVIDLFHFVIYGEMTDGCNNNNNNNRSFNMVTLQAYNTCICIQIQRTACLAGQQ